MYRILYVVYIFICFIINIDIVLESYLFLRIVCMRIIYILIFFRLIKGVFVEEVKDSYGFILWRYIFFDFYVVNVIVNFDNIGFCIFNCLDKGFFNMSIC